MPAVGSRPGSARAGGFTLLEILVAISVVALVMAVTVTASTGFYASMQNRAAARDVAGILATARHRAVSSGTIQDVEFDTAAGSVRLGDRVELLPGDLGLLVTSSKSLNRGRVAVIRFYPEGGSSGGEVALALPQGSGMRVSVDWLAGGVSLERYVHE